MADDGRRPVLLPGHNQKPGALQRRSARLVNTPRSPLGPPPRNALQFCRNPTCSKGAPLKKGLEA